jgi:hypothetical protein
MALSIGESSMRGLKRYSIPSLKQMVGPCLALALVGCSTGPVANLTSLAPAVQADAVRDNGAFALTTDQILLTDILRSRDGAPLVMGALSSMNGALSLSGTAGFSIPFGATPASKTQDSFAPSISGSTSPTYGFVPFNTQGFELQMLQPVSAAYVARQWDAGISRELLLLMFVKEIDFPEIVGRSVHYVQYINDPDDVPRFKAFRHLIQTLLIADAQLKTFDVLDPVGGPFNLYAPAYANSNDNNTKFPGQPNSSAYSLITSSNDGQYHVGNAIDKDGDIKKGFGQLYRVYAGQVAFCVNRPTMEAFGFPIPSPLAVSQPSPVVPTQALPAPTRQTPPAPPPQSSTTPAPGSSLERLQQMQDYVARTTVESYSFVQSSSTAPNTGPGATKGGATGNPSTSPSGGGTSSATTAALQAGRLSSVVDDEGCGPAQIVLHHTNERQFAEDSAGFVHVQWRSVAEIFSYLGAIVRYEEDASHKPLQVSVPPELWVASDGGSADAVSETAQSNPLSKDVQGISAAEDALRNCKKDLCVTRATRALNAARANVRADGGAICTDIPCETRLMFTVYRGAWTDESGFGDGLHVSYNGEDYTVPDQRAGRSNDSMTVLALLNPLVNLSNISGNLNTSQPLQLLPLP